MLLRVRDLGHGDAAFDRCVQVVVVRADAGGDDELQFRRLAIRSAVMYAGQKGCEMTTSASGSSRSRTESGPSLSEVTTRVCPASSRNFRSPSSPETLPSSSPGVKSIRSGVGVVCPL